MINVAVILTDKFTNKQMLVSKMNEFIETLGTIDQFEVVTTHAWEIMNEIFKDNNIIIPLIDKREELRFHGKNNKVFCLCEQAQYCMFFYNGHPNKPAKTASKAKQYSRTGNALEELLKKYPEKAPNVYIYAYKSKVFDSVVTKDNFIEINLDNDLRKRILLQSIMLDKNNAIKLAKDILVAVTQLENNK
ncbi:hypothetical protein [Sulfurospirillum arsenophilum]|uniref:hypothetical protein n=1 Tax=Sulfurospirillum arsenophilum TaxID=56698 RepID=UPI0005A8413E|nr:hypothetical protein [Sulfurospirillum arsenophilum]